MQSFSISEGTRRTLPQDLQRTFLPATTVWSVYFAPHTHFSLIATRIPLFDSSAGDLLRPTI